MGLDITAYKNIRKVDIPEGNEGEYHFSNTGFTQSNMTDFENEEIQIVFDEDFSFRAGAYSSYNKFRNELCLAANGIKDETLWASKDENLKFYWLINFSDCDGYIGTSYCKILYDEFCKYEEDIKSKLNECYHLNYNNFKKAFKLGSNNGLVDFH